MIGKLLLDPGVGLCRFRKFLLQLCPGESADGKRLRVQAIPERDQCFIIAGCCRPVFAGIGQFCQLLQSDCTQRMFGKLLLQSFHCRIDLGRIFPVRC